MNGKRTISGDYPHPADRNPDDPYPWHVHEGDPPSRWTLWRWRQMARLNAEREDVNAACELCFRPLHAAGTLDLRKPLGGAPYNLDLCEGCWSFLRRAIDYLTIDPPFRENEPPGPEEYVERFGGGRERYVRGQRDG